MGPTDKGAAMNAESVHRGTVLGGRYRLDDLLSENRGAHFWRGTDTVLGRSVAVNVLPVDDARIDRVLEAVRTSATVTDSRILRVLDCARDHDVLWVVNEWGEGTSLDITLQQGPLAASRAAWLAREVAESIAHAHRAGVAHGRLTPESVLVTDVGAVKLIGFAISAAIEGQAETTRGYGDPSPVDADVINLASILYAALTGRWSGISPSVVPAAPRDARGPLRPRQVRAGVPRLLDAICERVLRREATGHLMPLESAFEVFAALTEHIGDPTAYAPLDVSSLHTEPTIGLDRDRLREAITGASKVSRYQRLGTQGWNTDGLPMFVPAEKPASPPEPDGEPRDELAALAPIWNTSDQPIVSTPMAFANDPAFDPDEQPAPLEPYVDSPERPLFANIERRVPPGAPTARTHDQSPRSEPAPGGGRRAAARHGRPRLRRPPWWALLAGVLAVVIAVAAATAIYRSLSGEQAPAPESPTASPSTTASASVRIFGVHDFDPEGNPPSENPSEVQLAVDGDPQTGWHTSTYRGNPALGLIKSGVGLLLDLGSDQRVGSVDLMLTGVPTTLSIYAAPEDAGDPPTDVGSMIDLGGLTVDQSATTFRLDKPVHTRYLVVWLTRLPAVPDAPSRYRGQVDEVTVRS
jgi:serine/threonine protein kinase